MLEMNFIRLALRNTVILITLIVMLMTWMVKPR